MQSKLILKNILSSLVFQAVSVICGFITPILIISTYGSEVNGLLSSITQFLAYATLLESGFGSVLKATLYRPLARKNQDEIAGVLKSGQQIFRKIAVFLIIYLLVLLFVYPMLVGSEFSFVFSASLVLIMGMSTFFEYYLGIVYSLFLEADQKTYVVFYIQIATLLLNTIVTVILIKIGLPIQVVKLASAAIFIAKPIIQNLYVRKHYNLSIMKTVSPVKIKQRWHGLAQHIATVIHNNTDVVILTLFSSNISEVSVYAVYSLVINGVKRLVTSFLSGFDAIFGDLYAKEQRDGLTRNFHCYEFCYYSIASTAFACCLFLIVPFVSIYTSEVHDANYIRPVFAIIMVLAEFVYIIRLPYSTIAFSSGHFKETTAGAWREAIINIVVSIALVFQFGITGVAIGTLVAMSIRTFEIMHYVNKYIFKNKIWTILKRLLAICIEIIIIYIVINFVGSFRMENFFDWCRYAFFVASVSLVIILGINVALFRKDAASSWGMLRKIITKNKVRKK